MLLSLRDRVKGSRVLGTVIIVIISIPFALFGIGSYLGGHGDYFAAKVNDEEVSIRSYEQSYISQQNQLLETFGGSIPASFDSDSFLRKQALETAITQTLLLQHVSEAGYAIDDKAIATALYAEAAFRDGGSFSKERYERQLQSMGASAAQFEAQLRQNLSIGQMRESVLRSSFLTQSEARRRNALTNQTRTFSQVIFSDESIGSLATPSDEAITNYFSAYALDFKHAEKVKLEYIELNQTDLAANVSLSESALQDLYENQKRNYVLPEQRRASHILITISDGESDQSKTEKRQQLGELRARILAGESFEDLARQFSQDSGSADQGGGLGLFQRGVMVPAFEEAAFRLDVDELSEVVQSAFGYHLIRLDEIVTEQGKSFAQARAEVEEAYRAQEAESLFFELSETLANQSYENSDSLESASDATNIPVADTGWLERDGNSGLFRFPAVKNSAFTPEMLEEGLNSEVIEVGDSHVVVFRVLEHQPASAQTLEEVREKIVARLIAESRDRQLKALADESLAALVGGESLAALAGRANAKVEAPTTVSRGDPSIDSNVASVLFSMTKPVDSPSYAVARTLSGDFSLLALSAVDVGERGNGAENNAGRESIGSSEYSAWLATLRARADIAINKQLLDDISSQRQ